MSPIPGVGAAGQLEPGSGSLLRSKVLYSAEPARGWLPWGALAPFLGLFFVVAPFLGATLVLESLQLVDAKGDPIGLPGLLAILLFAFGLLGLLVLAWARFVERRPLATLGLVPLAGTKTFLRGHALGLVTSCAVVAAIWVTGGFVAGGYAKAFGSWSALASIGALLVGFAVQSSVEEIVFRGWMLSAITRKLNLGVAVVLTSLVFTLLHFSPRQHGLMTLNMFLFSLFTCCWAIQSNRIWGVMGWHAGWNWLMATGFELPITGLDVHMPALLVELSADGPAFWTGGKQGAEGSFFCTLFFAGASAGLLWRAARDRKELARQAAENRAVDADGGAPREEIALPDLTSGPTTR